MLASTAGALFMVTGFEALGFAKQAAWTWGYVTMALLVLVGIATTLVATEPDRSAKVLAAHAGENPLLRVMNAAVGAFSEFLGRDMAFVVLAFVVLYKFC